MKGQPSPYSDHGGEASAAWRSLSTLGGLLELLVERATPEELARLALERARLVGERSRPASGILRGLEVIDG